MEHRINIAELLKNCPKGMPLDCTTHDMCTLDSISILEDETYPIKIRTPEGAMLLTRYGSLSYSEYAKCVIFPKGKTTWEGFVPPCKFKEGDVIISSMGNIHLLRTEDSSYCSYRYMRENKLDKTITTDITVDRFATEEEKAKLFKVIKDNGYKWNTESKALEKLIDPKFKVGDKIRVKNGSSEHRIIDGVFDTFYSLQMFGKIEFTDQDNWELVPDKLVEPKFKVGDIVRSRKCPSAGSFVIVGIKEDRYLIDLKYCCIKFEEQDNYELVPGKFDINTLVPFESKVLVRDYNKDAWKVSFWGCLIDSEYGFKYDTIRGSYKQCILYEGNEHLLGKTGSCSDFYKNW